MCAAVVLASACKLCTRLAQVDVMTPRCKADGCTKYPCFNWPGEHPGLYCKPHAPPGMVRPSTVNQAKFQVTEESRGGITSCVVTGVLKRACRSHAWKLRTRRVCIQATSLTAVHVADAAICCRLTSRVRTVKLRAVTCLPSMASPARPSPVSPIAKDCIAAAASTFCPAWCGSKWEHSVEDHAVL